MKWKKVVTIVCMGILQTIYHPYFLLKINKKQSILLL